MVGCTVCTSEEGGRGIGTVAILTSSSGGHTINRFLYLSVSCRFLY